MSLESSLSIAGLYLHPLKSGASMPVQQALVGDTGLQYDREWMVVDADGEFVSQRELPRMVQIQPELRHSELVLRAPGMLPLHLRLDGAEGEMRVRVWNDAMPAFDMGDLAAQWCRDFLGVKGLRLAAFDSEARRTSEARYSAGVQALNAFSDGFPLLVLSQASLDEFNRRLQAAGHEAVGMERFRPNIVLAGVDTPHGEDQLRRLHIDTDQGPVEIALTKPCPRCPIPDVEPASAQRQPHISDVLRAYRSHERLGGAVAFGMNAVVVQGAGCTLRVGDTVRGSADL
ncbi:MAG: MOSC domain-containing protein [Betaproteobacteria bacterium]|nr:MOSC domain-containing protein [Betaproteobacteria bacterium]